MCYSKSIFILFLFISGYSFSQGQGVDAVKTANKVNNQKAKEGKVDDEVAEFLVKSADARMMDTQEGHLAAKKGTKKSIQKYGRWMVKDQAILLREIKKLAAKRDIALPVTLSNKKENGIEDLADKEGEDFDKKFIKMMTIDHERDIRLFKNAVAYDDKEVSAFAKKYLPTIQSHLDKIKAIEQSMN